MNLQGWLFQPNQTKALPVIFCAQENGKSPPPAAPFPETIAENLPGTEEFETFEPEPLNSETRRNTLVILRGMLRDSGDLDSLSSLSDNHTPLDWAWLMKELKDADS
jgi:hypothetical protein